jgi:hypothetical protein
LNNLNFKIYQSWFHTTSSISLRAAAQWTKSGFFFELIQAQSVLKFKLLETRFSGRVPGTLYLNRTAKVHYSL